MGYYPVFLGLLILISSVALLPTPDDDLADDASLTSHQEKSLPSSGLAKSNSRRSSRSPVSDGSEPFIFPDDDSAEKRFVPKVGKKTPECANGSTFCVNVDDYPKNYLENVLKNDAGEYRNMFGKDIVNETSLVNRIEADEIPLCPSLPEVVYPKMAKNKEEKWLFIVNQGEYVQGVRVEKCQSPDKPPRECEFAASFPPGYKSVCKQKLVFRKLIALNEGGKPVTDNFQIPSCCDCSLEKVGHGFHSHADNPEIASDGTKI